MSLPPHSDFREKATGSFSMPAVLRFLRALARSKLKKLHGLNALHPNQAVVCLRISAFLRAEFRV
jgi:hypothetical protein